MILIASIPKPLPTWLVVVPVCHGRLLAIFPSVVIFPPTVSLSVVVLDSPLSFSVVVASSISTFLLASITTFTTLSIASALALAALEIPVMSRTILIGGVKVRIPQIHFPLGSLSPDITDYHKKAKPSDDSHSYAIGGSQ